MHHLEKITGDHIFLYDRGYPGYWFYRAHTHHNQKFCMRLPVNARCTMLQNFLSSQAEDQIVHVTASDTAKRTCKEKGFCTEALPLRLIKVVLPSGEMEVLVSNLIDGSQYPTEAFAALYFKRWGWKRILNNKSIRY